MTITCPTCGHKAPDADFDSSHADEYWCPKCGVEFTAGEQDDGECEED